MEEQGDLRGLCVFAARPHDNISRRRLRADVLLVNFVAGRDLLEQSRSALEYTTHIVTSVRRNNAKKALASFFGEVGLLDHTLGGVEVWQIERGSRVTGVEDGS